MDHQEETVVLEYAGGNDLASAPWQAPVRFRHVPPVAVAIAFLGCIHFFWYSGPTNGGWDSQAEVVISAIVAAFGPFFVKFRGKKAFVLSCATLASAILFYDMVLELSNYSFAWSITWAAVSLMCGMMWFAYRNQFSVKRIINVCMLSVALGFFIPVANSFFELIFYDNPATQDYILICGVHVDPHDFYSYFYLATLWTGIAWIGRERKGEGKAKQRILFCGMSGVILMSIFYLSFGCLWIANWSVEKGYPFTRYQSAWMLMNARIPNARFYEILEHADWKQPVSGYDWRQVITGYLFYNDPRGPKRLAVMLTTKPSLALAEVTARDMAGRHENDVVPILLRYALATGSYPCTDAVVYKGIRQGAFAIIVRSIAFGITYKSTPRLTPDDRAKLITILGKDAGDDPYSWLSLLEAKGRGSDPSFPASIAQEADDIVGVFERYWSVKAEYTSRREGHLRALARSEGLEKECVEYLGRHDSYPQRDFRDFLVDGTPLFKLFVRSENETKVEEPNWDVVGTADLEREVKEFAARVDALPVVPAHGVVRKDETARTQPKEEKGKGSP